MTGAAIGIVFGVIQFALLFYAVRCITNQNIKILPMLAQFFCPMAGLLLCALVKKEQLLTCAICIIAILLLGAVVNFLIYAANKGRKTEPEKDKEPWE